LADATRTNSAQWLGAAPGISFAYACTFLWAFLWRSFVVTLPLWVLGPLAFLAIFPLELLSDPTALLQPENAVGMLGQILLVTTLLSLASLLLMAVAMRWTLRDFQRRVRPDYPHIMD
jgi:hypothetical protein